MVKVTNLGPAPEPFHVVGGKKGEPKIVDLRPGESADLELADRHSGQNTGREAAGLIAIGDKAGRETTAAQGAAVTTAAKTAAKS